MNSVSWADIELVEFPADDQTLIAGFEASKSHLRDFFVESQVERTMRQKQPVRVSDIFPRDSGDGVTKT